MLTPWNVPSWTREILFFDKNWVIFTPLNVMHLVDIYEFLMFGLDYNLFLNQNVEMKISEINKLMIMVVSWSVGWTFIQKYHITLSGLNSMCERLSMDYHTFGNNNNSRLWIIILT